MKPTYRIRDWDDHFETAESRKLKGTRWVPMPTKHDGKGFRRIAQHSESIAIFCAWNLIVQVASKMPTRGTLADTDGPLDAEDLAAKTGFPQEIFETALTFLSSERIGWVEVDIPSKQARPARIRQNPPEVPANDSNPSPEGKGIEGNGKEKKIRRVDKPRDPRQDHPALKAFRETKGSYPLKDTWDLVIKVVGENPDSERMQACWLAWRTKGYAPTNLDWLVDWYVNGIPEWRGGRHLVPPFDPGKPRPTGLNVDVPDLSPEEVAEAIRLTV